MDRCTNLSKKYGEPCDNCNECGKIAKLPNDKMNDTIGDLITAAIKLGAKQFAGKLRNELPGKEHIPLTELIQLINRVEKELIG